MKQYDRIIIGAGIYGLYAALYCAQKGMTVAILEYDDEAFGRATYVNQARVHMGYHYPRSLATATKSAGYFKRFVDDFEFCINKKFEQIYATSAQYSWTNAEVTASDVNTGTPCFLPASIIKSYGSRFRQKIRHGGL